MRNDFWWFRYYIIRKNCGGGETVEWHRGNQDERNLFSIWSIWIEEKMAPRMEKNKKKTERDRKSKWWNGGENFIFVLTIENGKEEETLTWIDSRRRLSNEVLCWFLDSIWLVSIAISIGMWQLSDRSPTFRHPKE